MAWSTSSWSFAEPASAAHLAGAAARRTVRDRARPRHGGRRLTCRRCRPVLHAPAGRRRPTSDPSWTPQHRPASVVGAAARRTVQDRARPSHGGRRLTCRRCRPVLLWSCSIRAPRAATELPRQYGARASVFLCYYPLLPFTESRGRLAPFVEVDGFITRRSIRRSFRLPKPQNPLPPFTESRGRLATQADR